MATIAELVQGRCDNDVAERAAEKNNALMEGRHWEALARRAKKTANQARRNRDKIMCAYHQGQVGDVQATMAYCAEEYKGALKEAKEFQMLADQAYNRAKAL